MIKSVYDLLQDDNITKIGFYAANNVLIKTKDKKKKRLLNVFNSLSEFEDFLTEIKQSKGFSDGITPFLQWTEYKENKIYKCTLT